MIKAVRISMFLRKGDHITCAKEGLTERQAQELKDAITTGCRIVLFPEKRVDGGDAYYTLRIDDKETKGL